MRYTFKPYRPDGSPRKTVGTFRLPPAEQFNLETNGSGYMASYNIPQFEDAWVKGMYDRPLYELEDDEEDT